LLSKINKQEGVIRGISALRERAISGEIGFLFFFDLAHKAGEGGSARKGREGHDQKDHAEWEGGEEDHEW
jgi:hypothetical protein